MGKMVDLRGIIGKKKLVTICSTALDKNNTGFSSTYPKFTYTGESRKEKSSVQISIPTYPENLVYYEHFHKLQEFHPTTLSFMYVGGDSNGRVSHDFSEYKFVSTCDFSYNFRTVRSLFHIVDMMPSCQEMRIFLDQNNLECSKEDEYLMSKPVQQINCQWVKTLIVNWDSNLKKDSSSNVASSSRMSEIIRYAIECLPNLENVKMTVYEEDLRMVCRLLEERKLGTDSKLTIKDGLVRCEVTKNSASRVDPQIQPNPSLKAKAPAPPPPPQWSSPNKGSCAGSDGEKGIAFPKDALAQGIIPPPLPPEFPILKRPVIKRKIVENPKSPTPIPLEFIKTEVKTEPLDVDDDITEVLPAPVPVEILDLVSDSDDDMGDAEASIPKKSKMSSLDQVGDYESVSGDELEWECIPPKKIKSEVEELRKPARRSARRNSLELVDEAYNPRRNNWEEDESDGGESVKTLLLSPEIIRSIRFDQTEVLKALNVAKEMKEDFMSRKKAGQGLLMALEVNEITMSNSKDSISPNDFREGVHFERPIRRQISIKESRWDKET